MNLEKYFSNECAQVFFSVANSMPKHLPCTAINSVTLSDRQQVLLTRSLFIQNDKLVDSCLETNLNKD